MESQRQRPLPNHHDHQFLEPAFLHLPDVYLRDIGGHGSVAAMTDSPILSGVARQMTGAAVLMDIGFLAATTQKNLPAICHFLTATRDS